MSSRPFELTKKQKKTLTGLGHILHRFQAASDQLYRQSLQGKASAYVAEVLDAGKPQWLLDHQASEGQREVTPRVIRPDLLLTDEGFTASELDAVPGGMGTLGWLSQLYSEAGFEIYGGKMGMVEGFRSLFEAGADILVSEESSDYRPEMAWLAGQLGEGFRLCEAENWEGGDREVYRFFELFDWEAIPEIRKMASGGRVTPPLKPHFEEKLWLALFWLPSLREEWRKLLRGGHLKTLEKIFPYGWVLDPAELPPHGAIPRLNVHSWDEVAGFSQRERRLVFKVSGFSELAWGSRGVTMGHDVSGEEWAEAIRGGLKARNHSPFVVQEFTETSLVEHPYYDPESGIEKVMTGRVRLCPYYFVDREGKSRLGGCLATIVPADKKKIHGMSDGIMVPCV